MPRICKIASSLRELKDQPITRVGFRQKLQDQGNRQPRSGQGRWECTDRFHANNQQKLAGH
jgi:hypothetical protein